MTKIAKRNYKNASYKTNFIHRYLSSEKTVKSSATNTFGISISLY